METQEILTGVYDLTIMMRPADLDTLEADGVLEKFDCGRFYKHELYGQEVATCHFEEAHISKEFHSIGFIADPLLEPKS